MRKILKISLIVGAALAVAGGALGYYVYSNLKPILTNEINKQLDVPVEVEDLSITGLRDFPQLGVKFKNVKIAESSAHYNTNLLEAGELNLFINLYKLYKGEYVIDGVTVRNGNIYLADLKTGSNYDIFKPAQNNDSSSVSFEIKDLKLVNCDLKYTHIPSDFFCSAFAPSSDIELKYRDTITQLRIKSPLDSVFLTLENEVYINKRNLKFNTAVDVNTRTETVYIPPSDVIIEDVSLKANGKVRYGDQPDVSIRFKSFDTKAQSLINTLPESLAASFNHIELSGTVAIDGAFTGKMYGNYNPSFNLNYSLENSTLSITGEKMKLSGIEASGSLDIPNIANLRTASVQCNLNKAKNSDNSLQGKLVVTNFEYPSIEWNGIADFSLPFLFALADNSSFSASEGRLRMDGQLKLVYDMEQGNIAPNTLFFKGKFNTSNVRAKLADPALDITKMDIDLLADNNKLGIQQADIAYNNTSIQLKGYMDNYAAFLEGKLDTFRGKLTAKNLNLNDLFSDDSATTPATMPRYLTPVGLDVSTNITNFQYNDFSANEIVGTLTSNRNKIKVSNCTIDALGGTTVTDFSIVSNGREYLLDVNASVRNININELFKQFNNFDQNEITDEHLYGKLKGTIESKVFLDANFEPDLSRLYSKFIITLEDGRLKGYEPLTELSAFVKIEDLRDVRFKTLHDTVEILGGNIFLDGLRIENNALNLGISGTHSFENNMYYEIDLSVVELLATKGDWFAKKKERMLEDNPDGGLTAYIIMSGTPDDLTIKYDKERQIEDFKTDMKNEKKNLLRALKGDEVLYEEEASKKNYNNVWDE